ncbi:hypothetical protein ACHAWF_011563, partial [Thalassiosira exigua]
PAPSPDDQPPSPEAATPVDPPPATDSSDGAVDKKSAADDDSDNSDSEGGGGGAKENEEPPPSEEELLVQAVSHKEDGNAHFKSGDYVASARSYRRGTTVLKKVSSSTDDQVKVLLVTIQTNLSMVCYKQKKHKLSRDVASKALEVDGANVKALYRRAVAHRALGDHDAAREDLRKALKSEPNNATVKKELVAVKKVLDERKKKEKAQLQKAFSKGGSSLLYSDMEEQEKRRAKERKKQEEERLQKRKKEWEDECVRRMSSDPPDEAISFEDWEKEREKAKKEEEERKRKEKREARKKVKAEKKEVSDDEDDDDVLTEKELAALRGYKKTSDGRTTSYFNREQSQHEKELIGCIKPKRLDSPGAASPTSASGTAGPSTAPSSGGVGSAWNQSGTTWEERDTTDWCKRTLERCLLDATAAHSSQSSDDATYVAVIREVKDLTGDASVALAGGKKRYIYDFHASAEYEVLDDGEAVVAKGTLRLPDVNSATASNEDELDVEVSGWKKAPKAGGEDRRNVVDDASECRTMLVRDVRRSVLRFAEEFSKNF